MAACCSQRGVRLLFCPNGKIKSILGYLRESRLPSCSRSDLGCGSHINERGFLRGRDEERGRLQMRAGKTGRGGQVRGKEGQNWRVLWVVEFSSRGCTKTASKQSSFLLSSSPRKSCISQNCTNLRIFPENLRKECDPSWGSS